MKSASIILGSIVIVFLALSVLVAGYNYGIDASSDAESDISNAELATETRVDFSADSDYGNANSTSDGTSASDGSLNSRLGVRSKLDISLGDSEDISLGAFLRARLSNGRYALIKIMPQEASDRAVAEMEAKCEERNCTVELREENVRGEAKAVYVVEAKKDARLLGFIKTEMDVRANVDAETGEVVEVRKPWWAFLAAEGNASSKVGY